MRAGEALKEARERLTDAGIDSPLWDAGDLLAHVLKCPRLQVMADKTRPLTDAEADAYFALVAKRAAREPLQYLTGEAPFMGLTFAVAPGALIPRMDSECLVEAALHWLGGKKARVLDLCCGPGTLALAIKHHRPEVTMLASDVSPEALAQARHNADRLGLSVNFRQGDLLSPFDGERFDLIVSNPPYIDTGALASLSDEVRQEPRLALDGGPDGLAFYRRIVADAPRFLAPGGRLLLEIGDSQSDSVQALLTARGYHDITLLFDLAGRPRALFADAPTDEET